MRLLTRKEHKVFDFIQKTIMETKVSPTLAEIGEACGIRSKGNVHKVVEDLVDKGWIKKTTGMRGIYLRDILNNLDLNNEYVRAALIDRGWVPPLEVKECSDG